MHLGHTDVTQPAQMKGTDRLVGFSGGGYSTSGEIFDAVYEDAKNNNSMFGLHQTFQDNYQANSKLAHELAGESIPGFETLRFKDVARSLTEGEALGTSERDDNYTVDLDMVNTRLKKLKETHPEIQTFEEMFAAIQKQAKDTENRAADVSARADGFGSVVNFMSGMVGAFNTNDPLNIATLPLGGWGKTATLRIATEMGIGGLSETINQVLGVRENREFLGLDNSTWRSVQQILFAAGGAGAFRGAIEGAPVLGKAVERKVAPQRALGRELLAALEEVGVPVRSEEFLNQLSPALADRSNVGSASTRAARQILEQEQRLANENPLGKTPEAITENHTRSQAAVEEYRAGMEDTMNGVETPRTSLFEDMNLRGERRGVPAEEITRAQNEASTDLDAEISVKTETITRLEDDIAKIDEKVVANETRPFSEFLREVEPRKADELAQIEAEKAQPGLGKTKRRRLAEREKKIRDSKPGQQANANRKADIESNGREKQIQRSKVQQQQKEIKALELRRERIRAKTAKEFDTTPKVKNPAQEKATSENVKLEDAEAPRIPGIPDRGGMSPSQHVEYTINRLEETDANLNRATDEAVTRVEQSFDEVDGTLDIGATRRVSSEMVVTLDDGVSMTLRNHLDDIKKNEDLVEAIRSCPI